MYKSKDWNFTRNCFLKWLDNNELKEELCKHIRLENLSIWWMTRLMDKDIVFDNKWYINLNDKLNKKKNSQNNNFFYLRMIIKLLKNFIKNIFFISFIKIFFKSKNVGSKKNLNCYYSMLADLTYHKNVVLNGCFSFAPLKRKKNNCYLTDLQPSFKMILNYFEIRKKISLLPAKNFILHDYISYGEIFKIYAKTFSLFIKTLKILSKKNYFILKKNDCSKILRPKLIESFFGNIQDALILSIAIKKFLKKNDYKNFITNGEFYPNFRSIYAYIKSLKRRPKILLINHADYNKDNLFLYLNKKDFSKNTKKYLRSPEPDLFFSQGTAYAKYLKNIFPNKKVFVVGSFKFDLAKSINRRTLIRNNIKKINGDKNKKIIVVLTSLKDEDYLVDFLNRCDLSKYQIILCAHPAYFKFTETYFNKNFNSDFMTLKQYHSREVMVAADLIISGYASLAYEAFFQNLNVIRIENYYRPNWTDKKDYIPVLKNPMYLNKYLNKSKNIPKSLVTKIEKKYFYKFDQKTYLRFCRIIKRL